MLRPSRSIYNRSGATLPRRGRWLGTGAAIPAPCGAWRRCWPSKAMTGVFSALRVDGQEHVDLALDRAQAAGHVIEGQQGTAAELDYHASSASVRTLPRPHGRIGDAGSALPLAHGLGGRPVLCGEGAGRCFSAREARLELAAPIRKPVAITCPPACGRTRHDTLGLHT